MSGDGFGADGIHEDDRVWLAEHANDPPGPDDGICFGVWNGEVLGPFPCKADAEAAQERKLDELRAQGVDIVAANPRMAVIFGDPAVYCIPQNTGKPNG